MHNSSDGIRLLSLQSSGYSGKFNIILYEKVLPLMSRCSKYIYCFRVHRDRLIITFFGTTITLKVTNYSVSRINYVTPTSDARDPSVYQRRRIMLISLRFELDITWSRKNTIGESGHRLFLCRIVKMKQLHDG